MSTAQQQQSDPVGPGDILTIITSKLGEYGSNARNNIADGVNNMTARSWIRLVIIVGGYMLLRQYVIKHSTKVAVRKLEQQEAEEKARAQGEAAKISPNDMRGLGASASAAPDQLDDIDADEHAEGTGVDWGSRARVKQRKFLREMLEREEQRRMEEQDDDDADIKEFLVD
ncbi:PGA2--like protein [Escovopsis weberi]|uniref:PGA2--like protein n=1 Tax=Escovopsis weberi TaxID=150374 RepID=A0A0M9VTB3_ESCWE|nr:PGA2--like protein [Escovopsis weberi]